MCDYFLKVYSHWVFWTIPEPCLSPKALFVWLMWSIRATLGRRSFSRPWLCCKRWARVRFSWTRVRHTCSVSANRDGAQNFWYMQLDCVNNRPVKQYIVRGPLVTASQTTQNNKPLCTPLCWARALLCHLHVLSETSCFPLMKSWRARCIQSICFYWKNTVIFHWLITINIYMQNICAVFRVICEEWQVGCQRLFLFIQYKIIQM